MTTLVDNETTVDTGTDTGKGLVFERQWQVILWNDDVNSFVHVIQCLMEIFHHPQELATKITMDVHEKGKGIAEVEDKDKAQIHKNMLQTKGLLASIESI